MRAFLAFDPDPHAATVLRQYLAQLQRAPWSRQVKWVATENLHGTLRFLGEIGGAHTDRLMAELEMRVRALAVAEPIELSFGEPRFFPTSSRPRVIACTVQQNARLRAIAAECEAAAVAIGLPPEPRRFNGHITLGRTRETWTHDNRIDITPAQHVMQVDAVTLYKSVLAPSGPAYTALRRWPLASTTTRS